ncbi:hypothetical protein [Streptococcus suis]|uniref:hypothetical protein n=1 Tax=Streptococcus suis TaxID=1307 RepID=UPI000CF5EA2A|nr:hypothetical protein [Streptococcus suis]MCQ9276240.1 hypothetical protein [Streptococcus suis]HEM3601119.1 hypothetical protein [Streptococcus suis]
MLFINQFKSQSKTVLAAVAISAATLGFAGGMSISKSSAGVSTQSQASLAQNGSVSKSGQVATQGMPPGQGGAKQDMSPRQGGNSQGMPSGQGTTPPDATSGATQSNSSTSSDEVNALKKRNQEIKSQISGDSSSSNQ